MLLRGLDSLKSTNQCYMYVTFIYKGYIEPLVSQLQYSLGLDQWFSTFEEWRPSKD